MNHQKKIIADLLEELANTVHYGVIHNTKLQRVLENIPKAREKALSKRKRFADAIEVAQVI